MTRRLILFVGLAGALLLAACGGSATAETDGVASLDETTTDNPGDDPGSDNSDPDDVEAAYMAFTECMRGEGVDMPDPDVDADGNIAGIRMGDPGNHDVDVEAIRAAAAQCQHHLEGVTMGAGNVDQSAMEDTILGFAACMRDEGIDFPDPDISGGGVQFGGGPGSLDFGDPRVQEAMDTCSHILDEAGVVRNVRPGN